MQIVGQDKLIKFIDSQNLTTLPRTIMLEGARGSGKHLICNYISDKFCLEQQDISDSLTYETIEEINLKIKPYLYIIDASKITVKNENAILKFLEEPLKNAFIVILTDNRYNQIETIRNRCHIMVMAKYDREQLKQFIKNEEDENVILTICSTPGDIVKMQAHPIKDMLDLCIKILDKIGVASFANTLTLTNNLAFKNEQDKYDPIIFFKALLYISKCRVLNNEPNSINEFNLTNDYNNRLLVRNVDKKALFENYLLSLKKMRMGI